MGPLFGLLRLGGARSAGSGLGLPARELALRFADGFLLLHTALLIGGNEPALAAHRAQHFAARNFFAEALQQRALRLTGPKNNFGQT